MRGRARVEVKSERTSGEVSTHRLGDEKVGERERESGRAGERESGRAGERESGRELDQPRGRA